MDIHASDPVRIAALQYQTVATGGGEQNGSAAFEAARWAPLSQSADIMELCRIFLLDLYLKRLGRARLFEQLQREHERHNLPTAPAFALLLACFSLTWLLQATRPLRLLAALFH